MEVAREQVISTIKLMSNFDHNVLYKVKSATSIDGFSTEYDIQRAIISHWPKTVFDKNFEIVGDEVPLNLRARNAKRSNSGRIDILAKHKHKEEYLVLELKRAAANIQAVTQVIANLKALKLNKEMASANLCGVLIAERIPTKVLNIAKEYRIDCYEISYPVVLNQL